MKKITLTIDNRQIEIAGNPTIAECAAKIGVNIPLLCYNKKNIEHKSACMVCAVWDNNKNNFAAACNTIAEQDMNIDASSEKVINFRKTALELLLSEHRGACIANCERVCPFDFPIQQFLRLIDLQKTEQAKKLVMQYLPDCKSCDSRCEKACLRKQYDNPITIKIFIEKFMSENINKNHEPQTQKKNVYTHTYGKLDNNELAILAETAGSLTGCFQCGCAGFANCKLQQTANIMNCSQFKYKPLKDINSVKKLISENIIFSPGKCIRCGVCVSISDLEFHNRGYMAIPAPADGLNYYDCIQPKIQEIIENCPTGAYQI